MVKSHTKMSKLFSYDGVVKCRRNLNFEKMDTASYTGKMMEFGVEYLRSTSNKCYYGSVKKSKCSFSCHLQIDWFFSWRPIKALLVCAFSPSLRMINLKKPYLIAPPGPTNYDKATYIVSSNLCLFTCPQATDFPWNSYPQRHISAKRVFLKFIPVFLMLTFQIINQYSSCESI